MDDKEVMGLIGLIGGIAIASICVFLLYNGVWVWVSHEQELGQAICEERVDKDFDSYSDGVLKCKNKEKVYQVQYDGITIEIGNKRKPIE